MNEFIGKHARLLRFYSVVAYVVGWSLLVLSLGMVVSEIYTGGMLSHIEGFHTWVNMAKGVLVGCVFPVLCAFIVAQFLRCLSEPGYRCGWFLRHGEKLLYSFAVVLVLAAVWGYIESYVIRGAPGFWLVRSRMIYSVMYGLVTLAKVLILVGFGQMLRKVMPIIEEHKSLV